MPSRGAICALSRPSTISSSTSRCRGVRGRPSRRACAPAERSLIAIDSSARVAVLREQGARAQLRGGQRVGRLGALRQHDHRQPACRDRAQLRREAATRAAASSAPAAALGRERRRAAARHVRRGWSSSAASALTYSWRPRPSRPSLPDGVGFVMRLVRRRRARRRGAPRRSAVRAIPESRAAGAGDQADHLQPAA